MEANETKPEAPPGPTPPKPSMAHLGGALAKAQGAMQNAKKDQANPYYNSRYTDLAGVWDVIRKPLSDNGLCVIQRATTGKGSVTVVTTLLHESGESISDTLVLPTAQETAQGYGSAITYARRYSLACVCGVASEADDDGNAASNVKSPATQKYEQRQAQKQAQAKTPALSEQMPERKMPAIQDEATADLHGRIKALLEKHAIKGNDAKVLVTQATGKLDRTKLVEDDFARIEAAIVARQAEDAADVP
jgi:hypothetical protein